MTKTNTQTKPQHGKYRRGYIEGYYGRLLTWDERKKIIDHLAALGMSDYFYAPKEDAYHRFQWRQPYDDVWRTAFRDFTAYAKSKNITISAGLAPGIDFDFAGLDQDQIAGGQGDYVTLLNKARQMAADGADQIGLLMDDIDPGFPGHAGSFSHEGAAHTALANQLAADLDIPLHLTPRIYADNIADDGRYLAHMSHNLNDQINVFTCGIHIVAAHTDLRNTKIVTAGLPLDRLIVWDNLYAHDYCPRRLFLGAYHGRQDDQDILLNPTGLVETDRLLLSQMATGPDVDHWHQTCLDHGVPDPFFQIAPAFWLPPHPSLDSNSFDSAIEFDNMDATLDALDHLLWRWKSPLQREWYPFLMGMRQDLLLIRGKMSNRRIDKTLPPLLAPHFKHFTKDK